MIEIKQEMHKMDEYIKMEENGIFLCYEDNEYKGIEQDLGI